jgi:hypothetical protein
MGRFQTPARIAAWCARRTVYGLCRIADFPIIQQMVIVWPDNRGFSLGDLAAMRTDVLGGSGTMIAEPKHLIRVLEPDTSE